MLASLRFSATLLHLLLRPHYQGHESAEQHAVTLLIIAQPWLAVCTLPWPARSAQSLQPLVKRWLSRCACLPSMLAMILLSCASAKRPYEFMCKAWPSPAVCTLPWPARSCKFVTPAGEALAARMNPYLFHPTATLKLL